MPNSSPHSKPFDIDRELEQLVYGMHDGHYDKAREHEVNIAREVKSLLEQLEASRAALIGFNLDGCRRMAREHEEEARRMLAGGRDTTDVAVGCIAESARVLAMCDAIELALASNPVSEPNRSE